MRYYAHLICGVMAIGITFLGLMIGMNSHAVLKGYYHTIDIHFEEDAVTVKKLEAMQASEDEAATRRLQDVVGWQEKQEVRCVAESNQKDSLSTVVTYQGNLTLLFKGKEEPSNRPTTKESIVITEGLAIALWGDRHNIGQVVEVEDENYTVVAIVKGDDKIVYQLGASKETLPYMRMVFSNEDTVQENLNQLTLTYQLPNHSVFNRSLETITYQLMMWILLGILGIVITWKLVRDRKSVV